MTKAETKKAKAAKAASKTRARELAAKKKERFERQEALLELYPKRVWLSCTKRSDIPLEDRKLVLVEDLSEMLGDKILAEYVLVKKGRTVTGMMCKDE